MPVYLLRMNLRPRLEDLPENQQAHLSTHFDVNNFEVNIDGEVIDWRNVDSVEVAKAARVIGPAGWIVRRLYGGERYHVAVYFGRKEAVLPNLPLEAAQYVVRAIGHYAPKQIRYTGPDGIAPTTEP